MYSCATAHTMPAPMPTPTLYLNVYSSHIEDRKHTYTNTIQWHEIHLCIHRSLLFLLGENHEGEKKWESHITYNMNC